MGVDVLVQEPGAPRVDIGVASEADDEGVGSACKTRGQVGGLHSELGTQGNEALGTQVWSAKKLQVGWHVSAHVYIEAEWSRQH